MTVSHALRRYRFWFLGVALLTGAVYASVAGGMVLQWYRDPNYSHGFVVPLISVWFVYARRAELAALPAAPDAGGIVLVVASLLLLAAGQLTSEHFTMRCSLIPLLAGLFLFFFGRAPLRRVLMPLGYLLLMVPLPYLVYDAVAFPLKQLVTGISVACLNGMGVVVLREGNILLFPNVTLEVADACSGIRSLTSLVALSIAFAWAAGTTPWRRWAIAASAVPLAIGTNALRVVLTGLLAQHWGGEAARGFFHESAGLAVFAAGTVLLAAFGMLLRGKS